MQEDYLAYIQELALQLYDQVSEWASSGNTYVQLSLIASAFLLSYGMAKIVRLRFNVLQEPEERVKPYSKRWFFYRLGMFVFPLLLMIWLVVAEQIALITIKQAEFIEAIQRVAFIGLCWVGLRAFILNPLVRTVGIWILLPAALLQLFGWFDPVVARLSSYGFSIGEVEITAYIIIKAIFFICIVIWLGNVIRNAMENYIRRNRSLAVPTKELLIKIFDILLYAVLFVLTLNLIGIDLTVLTVFGGALGVGLGFGLQKIASNFISGIILLSEKSININNLIEMDDGVYGYVRKLGARASIVETLDGKEVMVPNEDFITSRVANLTHSNNKGRIEIAIGVSYDSDMHQVYDLILEAACGYDKSSLEEGFEPQCYMREYGDNSVNFMLTFWLDDVSTGRWRAQSDVMFAVWDSFKEHEIEIPFPQRDIHIKSGLEPLADLKPPEDKSKKSKKTETAAKAKK